MCDIAILKLQMTAYFIQSFRVCVCLYIQHMLRRNICMNVCSHLIHPRPVQSSPLRSTPFHSSPLQTIILLFPFISTCFVGVRCSVGLLLGFFHNLNILYRQLTLADCVWRHSNFFALLCLCGFHIRTKLT